MVHYTVQASIGILSGIEWTFLPAYHIHTVSPGIAQGLMVIETSCYTVRQVMLFIGST